MPSNNRPVHFPANPTRFDFDSSVAPIFPDMAARSIPNYHEAHRLHAKIAVREFLRNGSRVIDIGASRGGFIGHLNHELSARAGFQPRNVKLEAIDQSPSMCQMMAREYPNVDVSVEDIRSKEFATRQHKYDIVNCMYVLQFIPPAQQLETLASIARLVSDTGVLFMGQKEAYYGRSGEALHNAYIDFRLGNGYSMEEINAKTAALKNSMWPMNQKILLIELAKLGFSEVVETTRTGVFSTLMCVR